MVYHIIMRTQYPLAVLMPSLMWAKVHGPLRRRTTSALVVSNVFMLLLSIAGVFGSFMDLLDELHVMKVM